MKKHKILLAESKYEYLVSLKTFFNGMNIDLFEARDGCEAVELYRDIQPDLVILCLYLDRKDGVSVADEIFQAFPNANIVILTNDDPVQSKELLKTLPSVFLVERTVNYANLLPILKETLKIEEKKKKVLIVDDSITVIQTMQRVLEIRGYVVVTCNQGEKAIEKLEQHNPDVLILDYQLEKRINGLDICRKIRNINEFLEMPILMLTVMESQELKLEAFESGIYEFFNKKTDKFVIADYIDNYFLIRRTSPKNINILIVEDSVTVSEIIKSFVTSIGFHSVAFPDGESALLYLQEGNPCNVIISDLFLPNMMMDGIEFIRQVRNTPDLNSIPIISITGVAQQTLMVRAFLAGANSHLFKPFQRDELIIKLLSLVELNNIRNELSEKDAQIRQLKSQLAKENA